MNPVDRAISFFAPSAGLRRVRAREAMRSYEGAQFGPRDRSFGPRGRSANSASMDFSVLRDRARHMVRNTSHGAAIVDRMQLSVIGSGITPVWNTGVDRIDRQVQSLWDEWAECPDIEGQFDFSTLQALAVRSMIEGGEALVRFVDLSLRDDAKMPFRIQLLEGDHVDTSRTGKYDGRDIQLGIALGPWRQRLGFYLFPNHPGDLALKSNLVSTFVGAEQIAQIYRPMRIGQLRGVSWLAPVLMSARDLSDLIEFTLIKARNEASFAGFITNDLEGSRVVPTEKDFDKKKIKIPEPGMMIELMPGQDITFAEPKTAGQFREIALWAYRAMAAGVGLTYDQITGDLTQANYSSLRAGKIEHRRLIEQVQWHIVIPQFCRRIAKRWIDRLIIAGTLRPRKDGYNCDWVTPANEPVDPKKDLEADMAMVRAGRMTPQQFIAAWGGNWRSNIRDTAEFFAEADAAGVAFDIDGRRAASGGGTSNQSDQSQLQLDLSGNDSGNP